MSSDNNGTSTGSTSSPRDGETSTDSTSPTSSRSLAGGGDRVDEILQALNDPTLDTLPDHLRMKYTDGFTPENLEEQLQSHPFFMTQLPDPSQPLPPLLEAFQQLKYSETENTHHELALNHKEDGMFHFKIKKYRIAAICFTTALSHEFQSDVMDKELVAQLYNNRSACMWYIKNYRTCLKDCEEAVIYKSRYMKVFKRAVFACEVLERWDEVDSWCSRGERDMEGDPLAVQFFCDKRRAARRGKSAALAKERKLDTNEKLKESENNQIRKMVTERGIRMRTDKFLESGVAVDEGKIVKIVQEENGNTALAWPVLFLYPQYNQSDFIEQFDERDTFKTHLAEMLDEEGPGWDVDREFKSDNVSVFYLSSEGNLAPVPVDSTLLEAMKMEVFWVPTNGVPSFFVLANNEFSNDFRERIGA